MPSKKRDGRDSKPGDVLYDLDKRPGRNGGKTVLSVTADGGREVQGKRRSVIKADKLHLYECRARRVTGDPNAGRK